jgi:uncharacterized RDD family membrane protein YckC
VTQPPPSYPPPGYPPPQYGYPPQGGYSVPRQAALPPGYRLVPAAPNGAPLADFGERLGAYFIDGLIMGAIVLVPTLIAMVLFITTVVDDARTTDYQTGSAFTARIALFYALFFLVVFPFQVLVRYLYLVSYQLRRGQTIGKRAMKIKIVNLADGSPMTVTAARKRWLLETGAAFVGPLAYVDGLWQLWDQPYKQCLHDKWAQTVVVRVRP